MFQKIRIPTTFENAVVTKVSSRTNVLVQCLLPWCLRGIGYVSRRIREDCEQNRHTRLLMHISDRDRRQQDYTKRITKDVLEGLSPFRTSLK